MYSHSRRCNSTIDYTKAPTPISPEKDECQRQIIERGKYLIRRRFMPFLLFCIDGLTCINLSYRNLWSHSILCIDIPLSSSTSVSTLPVV